MIPESKDGRSAYIEARDMKSRHRQMMMKSLLGDLDEFNAFVLANIGTNAEMPYLRESVDFATDEGILTEEMIVAADNAILWGVELRRLIAEKVKPEVM